jgi:hypothetical protein
MDYGSGFYNGQFQFHPANRDKLCTFMATIKQRSCPVFLPISNPSLGLCGDRALSPTEDCECMDGSASCGECVRCKLISQDIECSTRFAIRRPTDRGIVHVTDGLLAAAECCVNNRVQVATHCNGGRDMCSVGGYCVQVCKALGLGSCGIEPSGCRQRCFWAGRCVDSSPALISQNVVLNAIVDSTPCRDPAIAAPGVCSNGVCIAGDGSSPSSSAPSSTHPNVPTSRPTSPMNVPTTKVPTIPHLPTDNCTLVRTRNACTRPCSWCGGRGCVSVCPKRARRSRQKWTTRARRSDRLASQQSGNLSKTQGLSVSETPHEEVPTEPSPATVHVDTSKAAAFLASRAILGANAPEHNEY